MILAFALTITVLPFHNNTITGSFPLFSIILTYCLSFSILIFVGKNYIFLRAILTICPKLLQDYVSIGNCQNISFLPSLNCHIQVAVKDW